MTDTAAPRFTEQEFLDEADVLYQKYYIEKSSCLYGMLRQAAADLAERPTREELIDVAFATWKTTGSIHAIVDALIAAGVKVRL